MAIKTYIPKNKYPVDSESIVLLYDNIVTGSSTTEWDITNIPQLFKHLRFEVSIRSSAPAQNNDNQFMQFNGDTGNNYDYQQIQSQDTSPTAAENQAGGTGLILTATAGTGKSNTTGNAVVDILNYSQSTYAKSYISTVICGITSTSSRLQIWAGDWNNTSAINRIRVYGGNAWVAGSRITLWGLK